MKTLFKIFLLLTSLTLLTACDTDEGEKHDDVESHEIVKVYVSIDNQLIVEHYNGSSNTHGKIETVKKIELTDEGELIFTYNDGRVESVGFAITYLENPYVERRVTEKYIQWRKLDEDIWRNLIPLELLEAKDEE